MMLEKCLKWVGERPKGEAMFDEAIIDACWEIIRHGKGSQGEMRIGKCNRYINTCRYFARRPEGWGGGCLDG